MTHFQFLSALIQGAIQTPFLLILVIMLGVFVLEDPTTVIVGILAADGFISVPLALSSLYAGIILGDIVLYSIGYLASMHPRLARYVDYELATQFRTWLETRYILTVFSARFVPFARFPTYTSSGFFRSPLGTFIIVITAAASVWTTALFSASYWFSSLTATWLEPVRWVIASIAIIALFLFGRHNVLKRNLPSFTKNAAADIADDTHTP